mgnify:CR=1 FL=1
MSADDTLVMILAGGEGKRLYPLTRDRAKPAVPFGGRYRIIDFVLSNFINSGFYKIKVLTQYKSDSLNIHISRGWALSSIISQFIDPVPAQMRTGGSWYKGTADAVYQNIFHISHSFSKKLFISINSIYTLSTFSSGIVKSRNIAKACSILTLKKHFSSFKSFIAFPLIDTVFFL